MFLAILIFFCFNYYIFTYVSKILTDFKKNSLIYFFMSLINTHLMLIAYDLKCPYYISYFFVLFILTIEFLIFSKAKFIQAFLCSGIIIINISTIQLLVIPIYSNIINVTSYEVFYNKELFFHSLSIIFIILTIIFNINIKYISSKDIVKLSTAPMYAIMICGIVIFMLSYTIIDVIVLQSKQYFSEYLPVFISTPVLNIILFYTLFFYSIKSVNMVMFKRKSDELELVKIKNNISKKNIEDKILKDDLTGCYNRKYIMLDLEEKYKNNIFNFAIFFIDIDGLKNVNDTLGHEIGDEYILNVSKVLINSVREDDIIARLGGDEFIIIVNNIEEKDVNIVLDRITKKIILLDKLTIGYKVSASLGITFINEELLKTGVENIIKIADDKMRIEKKLSKGERL